MYLGVYNTPWPYNFVIFLCFLKKKSLCVNEHAQHIKILKLKHQNLNHDHLSVVQVVEISSLYFSHHVNFCIIHISFCNQKNQWII